jgi:hypothetical protein
VKEDCVISDHGIAILDATCCDAARAPAIVADLPIVWRPDAT